MASDWTVEGQQPALKLLAQQLKDLEPAGQQFRLANSSLPAFDRVWVQGTVQRKVASSLRLDDGTGCVDCTVSATVASHPGVDLDSVAPGAFVLVQGRLQARPAAGGAAQYSIKALKLLNLSKQCEDGGAQRMLSWGLEVAELQRLLEADAAAA